MLRGGHLPLAVIRENLEQVVLRAVLPNDFSYAPVSRVDRVILPKYTACGVGTMFIQSMQQQLQQRWILVLLEDDLIEKLLGKNLLLLGRERENFWQTFHNHGERLSRRPPPSLLYKVLMPS